MTDTDILTKAEAGKAERYPTYNDSGVDWLSEIPAHWEVIKLKRVVNLVSEKVASKDSTFQYIGMDNIESWTGRYIESSSEVEGLANYFEKGDILFGKLRPYLAKVYLPLQNGICSTEFLVLRCSNKANKGYLHKSLLSPLLISLINSSTYGSKMPRASWEFIGDQFLPIPPLSEQTRIAEFLGRKTAQIDQAIAQKERLIELLNERGQVMIHKAITRGLNPDVPMKDSGIDWIGEIPGHWEATKVKNIFRLIVEPAANNNNFELLSVYTDIGVKPRKELEERGNKASTTDGYWLVKKGDIIVNKLLAWMGAIGISHYDGVTSPAYDILRAKRPISGEYYHTLFRSPICSSELKRHSRGIMDMRLRLYFDKFGDILVPYPPIVEQLKITEKLNQIDSDINKAKGLLQSQIEKLQELKSTLINSAVTGKIRV